VETEGSKYRSRRTRYRRCPGAWSVALVALELLVSSCSADGDTSSDASRVAAEPRRICDGSKDVRLLWQRYPQGGPLGSNLLYSAGSPLLVVDGRCRYWTIGDALESGGEVREGRLSGEQENALHDALRYDEWPSLMGIQGTAVWDSSRPIFLSDTVNHLGCVNCGEDFGGVDEVWSAMFASAWAWNQTLYESGTSLQGAVLALAVNMSQLTESALPRKTEDWTLETPLSPVFSYEDAAWMGRLSPSQVFVIEQPDADVVRSWRKKQLTSGYYYEPGAGYYVPVTDAEGTLVALFARDRMPFESADGTLPFSPFYSSSTDGE
jgi:hypothetical protein